VSAALEIGSRNNISISRRYFMTFQKIIAAFTDTVSHVVPDISQYAVNPGRDFTHSRKMRADRLIPFLVMTLPQVYYAVLHKKRYGRNMKRTVVLYRQHKLDFDEVSYGDASFDGRLTRQWKNYRGNKFRTQIQCIEIDA